MIANHTWHFQYQCLCILLLTWLILPLDLSAQSPRDILDEANKNKGKARFELLIEYLDVAAPSSPHENDALTREILQWAKTSGDTLDRLKAKLVHAKHMASLGNLSRALLMGTEVKNSTETSDKLLFATGLFLRNQYFKLGSYDKAIAIHSELDWDDATSTWEKLAPDNFLAITYLKLGEYDRAIELYQNCVKSMRENQQLYWELSFTNSLGVAYEKQGHLDSAWSRYKQALKLLETHYTPGDNMDTRRYRYIEGLFYGNMAQVLASQGKHLQAIPLFKRDIEASLRAPGNAEHRQNAIISLIKLSDSYIATEQIEHARDALVEAKPLLNSYEFPEQWLAFWKSMWRFYELNGTADSALWCANRYTMFRDSFELNSNLKRSQDLLLAYEWNIRDQQLAEQQAELSNLKFRAEQERLLRNLGIGGMVLLAIILVFFYFAYRERLVREYALAEQTNQIKEQRALIENSLKEKDILLREVHHRVKNNLQIISSLFFLQSKKINDPVALDVIREGQSRVQVMSLIHQKLYQSNQLDLIDFQSYFSDLAKQILKTYDANKRRIGLEIEAVNISIPVDKAVPLGLIINELITNSMKHAFVGREKGFIKIKLYQTETTAHLLYSDDGKGVTDVEGLASGDSLGLRLIRLLTNQLDGKMELFSDQGFQVDIAFPAR